MGFISTTNPVFKGLTDKESIFVTEYPLDLNPVRAAKEAGYANPSVAACILMKKEKIQKALCKRIGPYLADSGLTQEKVLVQLYRFFFRNLLPYLNEDGSLKCSLAELPEDIQQCVEEIKVKRRKRYDKEGDLIGIEEDITLGFVRKSAVLEPIMKYLGMLQPDVTQINQQFNNFPWHDLLGASNNGDASDVIDTKFKELESHVNEGSEFQ